MMFEHLPGVQLKISDTIADAMRQINHTIVHCGGHGIVLAVDEDDRLVGVVTDGDIRRGLVNQHTLASTLDKIMTTNPVTTVPGKDYHQLLRLFQRGIRHIPTLDNGVFARGRAPALSSEKLGEPVAERSY